MPKSRYKGVSILANKSNLQMPDTFCIVDTETTGISASCCHLIEISALKVKGGAVAGKFSQLINPPVKVSYQITRITGISNDMLAGKPSIEVVIPHFLEFIGNDLIVAHNAAFDLNFLNFASRRYLDFEMQNDYLDTLTLFRRLHKELPHHRLMDVADYYSLSYEGAHRALADCEILFKGLCRMLEEIRC